MERGGEKKGNSQTVLPEEYSVGTGKNTSAHKPNDITGHMTCFGDGVGVNKQHLVLQPYRRWTRTHQSPLGNKRAKALDGGGRVVISVVGEKSN